MFCPPPSASAQQSLLVNRGVVQIETGNSTSTSLKIVEDLASLVDDGSTRRVVPVVGKGAVQNLIDLRYLRGIDMAILPSNVMDYVREQNIAGGADFGIYYIAKLYNEELHILARPEINSVADLANKTVNVDPQGSTTASLMASLLRSMAINATFANDPYELALEKLKKGDIAAVAILGGKPIPVVAALKSEDGVHLLPIAFDRRARVSYLPAQLSSEDYPTLVTGGRAVETIALGNVLGVADLRFAPERYRNVNNFVEAFFTGFQTLLSTRHHPKWRDVNLAAEVPGWRRFPAAEQWLQRNQQAVATLSPDDLRTMFSRFVDERRQASGGATLSIQEKNDLFEQFRRWQSGQSR